MLIGPDNLSQTIWHTNWWITKWMGVHAARDGPRPWQQARWPGRNPNGLQEVSPPGLLPCGEDLTVCWGNGTTSIHQYGGCLRWCVPNGEQQCGIDRSQRPWSNHWGCVHEAKQAAPSAHRPTTWSRQTVAACEWCRYVLILASCAAKIMLFLKNHI